MIQNPVSGVSSVSACVSCVVPLHPGSCSFFFTAITAISFAISFIINIKGMNHGCTTRKGRGAITQHRFTQGNILKQMVYFSVPMMLANVLQVSYQFIDSLWVGNLIGVNALGAVTVSSAVIFTVLSFILGINNAALTILSQQQGKQDEDGLKRYLNAFVFILTVLAAVLGVIGFFTAESILRLLDTPPAILQEATVYLQINFAGVWFVFGYNFIGTVLRALGDSRTPLKFVFVAVVLNAVLDPLFIAGFHLGIEGAAYATVLSQSFAFFYGMVLILRKKRVPFTVPRLPKISEIRLILKLGIPSGLQMMAISAGLMAIMSVVNTFGEDVVAGFGAAQRLDSILMIPAQSLGIAVNSMAGQNIGARQWRRVHQIARYGVLLNLGMMLVIALAVAAFADWGIAMFVDEEKAVQFGADYLRFIVFLYPFLGINFVLNGIVRASGAMFQVLVLNIVSFWVLRYPLTYVFANLYGEQGIAYGIGISFVISSLFAYGYYKLGKWKDQDLFAEKKNAS